MGDLYRFLEEGERIEKGDEGVRDDCCGWEAVGPIFVGMPYRAALFKVCRRKVDPTAEVLRLRGLLDQVLEKIDPGLCNIWNDAMNQIDPGTVAGRTWNDLDISVTKRIADEAQRLRTVLAAIDAEQGGGDAS